MLLDAIAGPDPSDTTTVPNAIHRSSTQLEQPVRSISIGVPRNFFYDKVEGDMAKLLEASLHELRRLGAKIVPVDVPDPQIVFDLAQIIAKAEAAAIHEPWLPVQKRNYDHGIVEGMAAGWQVLAVDYLRALRYRGVALQAWLDTVFTAIDVLHTPVYEHRTPTLDACAPNNSHAVAAIMATFGRCTRPFSYLGLPALAVPCGFQSGGLPAAFQLVGRPFDEALLLNLGHLYQQETGWHTRRPEQPSA